MTGITKRDNLSGNRQLDSSLDKFELDRHNFRRDRQHTSSLDGNGLTIKILVRIVNMLAVLR
jgi:hypothetical protein